MPAYFSKFPKLIYGKSTVVDILHRIGLSDKYKNRDELFYLYRIKDGDTIENIAAQYYDDPNRHWIIMLSNEIFDNYKDMPMDFYTFDKYISKKYNKSSNTMSGLEYAASTQNPDPFSNKLIISTFETLVSNIHGESIYDTSKENREIFYIDNDTANSTITGEITLENKTKKVSIEKLSIYDFETIKNEQKRFLKLLKKEYVPGLEKEFNFMVFK